MTPETEKIWSEFTRPVSQEEIYERAEEIHRLNDRTIDEWSQSIFDAIDELKPKH